MNKSLNKGDVILFLSIPYSFREKERKKIHRPAICLPLAESPFPQFFQKLSLEFFIEKAMFFLPANAAFIATVAAADNINPDKYKTWAMSQINYILGDNKYHMSYEVGFGNKYPEHAHHRGR